MDRKFLFSSVTTVSRAACVLFGVFSPFLKSILQQFTGSSLSLSLSLSPSTTMTIIIIKSGERERKREIGWPPRKKNQIQKKSVAIHGIYPFEK